MAKMIRHLGSANHLLILGFLGLFFWSGCGFWGNTSDPLSWEDEILWMDECGHSDMRCCLQQEPNCDEGLICCFSPVISEENLCRSDCSCGVEGAFCCAGEDRCGSGLACVDNICRVCGESGQYCCPGDSCGSGSVCYQGKCLECGLTGNPCCDIPPFCVYEDKSDESRSDCLGGICRVCGWGGASACASEPACAPQNILNAGICHKCGGYSEPCCRPDGPEGKEALYCLEPELHCRAGFCTK